MSAEGAVRDGNDAGFELIETLRWEPASGFVRLERHLARLDASARRWASPARSRQVGEGAARGQRRSGAAAAGAADACAGRRRRGLRRSPSQPLSPDAVWTLRHRRRPGSTPAIRCCATRRRGAQIYDAARAEFSRDEADEVILLNERGEVCEGTITNVFVDTGDGGPLLTPRCWPAACCRACFAGELIDAGKAQGSVLTVDDLRRRRMSDLSSAIRCARLHRSARKLASSAMPARADRARVAKPPIAVSRRRIAGHRTESKALRYPHPL